MRVECPVCGAHHKTNKEVTDNVINTLQHLSLLPSKEIKMAVAVIVGLTMGEVNLDSTVVPEYFRGDR